MPRTDSDVDAARGNNAGGGAGNEGLHLVADALNVVQGAANRGHAGADALLRAFREGVKAGLGRDSSHKGTEEDSGVLHVDGLRGGYLRCR